MGTSEIWYGVVTGGSDEPVPGLRVSDHPFLRGMSPAWIAAVSRGSLDTTFESGEFVIREGQRAERFHLLFYGEVAIDVGGSIGRRRTVQTVGPGEVLDGSGLWPPYLYSCDGRAVRETRVVSLDASILRHLLETRPVEGYRFLERLLPVVGRRLENARARLLAVPER